MGYLKFALGVLIVVAIAKNAPVLSDTVGKYV